MKGKSFANRAAGRWISLLVLALLGGGCSVIVEKYGSETVFGYTTSGVYDQSETYLVGQLICSTELVPARATEVPATAGNWFNTLSASYPPASGWVYSSAVRKLSRGTLEVKTYDAQGTAARVGAEFHVKYRPGASDPKADIHWVQVVTDNHNVTTNPGHGNAENVVDVGAAATTPYYDQTFAADSGACAPTCDFYDFPGRVDAANSHNWDAVLHLVTGPNAAATPGAIQIQRPGVSWGWRNSCSPFQLPRWKWFFHVLEMATFTTDGDLKPGQGASLSLSPPAAIEIQYAGETTQGVLDSARIDLEIEPLEVQRPLGPQGQTWRVRVIGGGARVATNEGLGDVGFEIEGGEGAIQVATGELSLTLELRAESESREVFAATGAFYGLIDERRAIVTFSPASQVIQNDPES